MDPEKLGEAEFYKLWNEYQYIKSEERIFQLNILRQVINEAFGDNK